MTASESHARPSGLETMARAMESAGRYYRWIHEAIRPGLGQRVLEVGPGYGSLIPLITAEGRTYVGVDSDPVVVERLRTLYSGRSGVVLEVGDVRSTEVQRLLRTLAPDTILSINVIEHIADPVEHLKALRAIAPEASLVLVVPAHPVLYGTLDAEAGHFTRYRKDRLLALVERVARVQTIRYLNSLGAVGWFLASRVFRWRLRGDAVEGGVSLFERLLVPISRWIDPLTRRFVGQSLVCLAHFTPEVTGG